MKRVKKILSYVLVALVASMLTMAVGMAHDFRETSKLDMLADLIETCFVGEVDRTAMEDAAAEAMVNSLGDRWSYYISAEDYAAHVEQMNNAYVGIGITISPVEGQGFEIVQVTEGGSAEQSGLMAGDLIVEIDGTSTAAMTTSEAKNLVRGTAGTQVALTILRDGVTDTRKVARQEIQTAVATGQLLEGKIGLVTIENFDSRCADETIAAIEMLLEQGAVSLIFDVRNNPGGYKSELVQVLDYLLPEGPLFRSEDYKGQVLVDESDAACLEIPMAVLVNGRSYSAAEFFAAALREYGVATVIGEQTSGKGYFQYTYQLPDGSAVGLSVGEYTTPNGVSLAETGGLTPDVVVELEGEMDAAIYAGTLDPELDPQIQAAINALTK